MGNSKYDREGGIHRVPIWRIVGFALNNTATNIWLLLMSFIAYYINGWVGLGVVLAGSFSMIMRIWDGVTDLLWATCWIRPTAGWGKTVLLW